MAHPARGPVTCGLVCRSLLTVAVLVLPTITPAQQTAAAPAIQPRITAAIDDNQLTTLRGNTHPFARAQFDRGAAPVSLPMQRMLLVLQRGADQEAALDQLLEDQQNAASPNYHHWLTPQQFGQQFGPNDQDIQTVTGWLRSHGFQIASVSNGRTVIEFSGTAGQVRDAFHTEIHQYNVNGENHWANSSDPQIPAALAPVVAGVDTLHNFPRQSMYHVAGVASRSKSTGEIKPAAPSLFTLGGNCGVSGVGCHAVGPYDFAAIYDVLPLWTAAPAHIDGTGQTIAVVAESNINIQDVRDFRNFFGLPAKDPQIIVSGPDPGLVTSDETEADLDVEWSGAIAPNATIDLVVSESTESSLGADLSAQYAVDNNLAPILSVSFGICEAALGPSGNQFFNQLWQQAAAQGITVLVGTGDSGSAVCDRREGNPPLPAEFGLQVSGFSSTPYNVAVGGTDFNDLTNPSTYWNPINSAPPGNPNALATVSAKSYIPETTWNSTCTNGVFGNPIFYSYSSDPETNCNNPQLVNFVTTVGGSGGKSSCTVGDGQDVTSCSGGYAKPAWQTGTGVPNDGKRDVPDVSLFASVSSPSGTFYVICEADFLSPGSSSCDPTNPSTNFIGIGGTSESAPSFAAIMALVDQQTNSRQGNANYVLYKLATQQPSAFHDVPGGGTIAMPCAKSSPNCVTSHTGDQFGVLSGYSTTAGYDLATGLGSVDANNLVTKWSAVTTTLASSATTLSLSPASITHGQSVNVNIGVTSGSGTPTGNVSLIANTGPSGLEGVQGFALTSGSVASTTNALPGGNYTVVAQYPGDGTFASSTSSTISVTVEREASQSNTAFELFDPVTGLQTSSNSTTAQYGSLALLRMNVTSQSGDTCAQNAPGQLGCPTGNVTVTNNGTPLDAGTYQLNSQGYAEDQTIQLPVGTDNLNVTYAGDNSFTGSNISDTVTVAKAATTTTEIFNPQIHTVVIGSQLGPNGMTKSQSLGVAPTGSYTVFDGTTSLSPTGGSSFVGFPGSPNAEASCQGVVVVTLSGPPGPHSLTISYSGDANYLGSVSAPVVLNAVSGTQTAVTASTSSVQQGQNLTFTATVTPAQSGGPTLTGSVQFQSNGSSIGTASVANGQAQLATTSLAVGSDQITAVYSGDSNYAGSTSPVITETVTPGPTFTVSANPSTITIPAPGQSGSTALTLTSQNGLTGSGGLASPTCGISTSEEVTCSLTAFTLSANGTAQPTLTFFTTAASMAVPLAKNRPTPPNWKTSSALMALACLLHIWIATRGGQSKRRRWSVVLTYVALAFLAVNAGCGGGGGEGGGGGGGGNVNPGTPLGSVPLNVTITINGVTQAVPNLIVNVQ
jgi:hypothetical protein